jgi:hypothetical protein
MMAAEGASGKWQVGGCWGTVESGEGKGKGSGLTAFSKSIYAVQIKVW